MPRKAVFVSHPLPWVVVDEGDDCVTIVDVNNKFVVYKNRDLTIEEWHDVTGRLNRTVPTDSGRSLNQSRQT